eukprot:1151905-Pelagomonas_calceolata.AAC.4
MCFLSLCLPSWAETSRARQQATGSSGSLCIIQNPLHKKGPLHRALWAGSCLLVGRNDQSGVYMLEDAKSCGAVARQLCLLVCWAGQEKCEICGVHVWNQPGLFVRSRLISESRGSAFAAHEIVLIRTLLAHLSQARSVAASNGRSATSHAERGIRGGEGGGGGLSSVTLGAGAGEATAVGAGAQGALPPAVVAPLFTGLCCCGLICWWCGREDVKGWDGKGAAGVVEVVSLPTAVPAKVDGWADTPCENSARVTRSCMSWVCLKAKTRALACFQG